MKISKRARTIILWCVAIGLLLGMVISFTPTLGLTFGGQEALRGTVQLTVNGAEIREAEVLQAQQGTIFGAVSEGPVARQLQRLLVDELVRQEVVRQAAAPMRVTNGEVTAAVNEFRESRGLSGRRNDTAYLNLLRSAGFTDQTFRDALREDIKLQKWRESVVGDVTVSDAEVEAYYLSHQSAYQSEERVRARQIVVADRETAEQLRAQLVDGASFAELAAEHSLELADRQGAVGAAAGETEPRPVGRAAFPTAVANAAFALRGAGLTEVVEASDGFYLVQVVEYVPTQTRPLEEVRDQVAEDALAAKRAGILEAEIERLRASAVVTFPETSTLSFANETVAQVGDAEITEVQLDRATYTNTTIQQALSPDTAELIVQLFRPAILQQLIDTELAFQGAQALGAGFVGTRTGVAQAALNYVARDVEVTEEQVRDYYERNIAAFTVSAEANVTQVEFGDSAAATAFRTAVLGGADLSEAAAANGGEVADHGRVRPGDLEADVDAALFGTDAFDPVPGSEAEVSDVLVLERPDEGEPAAGEAATEGDDEAGAEGADAEAGDDEAVAAAEAAGDGVGAEPATVERFVVLVAERTPETVRPLEDVRAQVENAVRAEARQRAQEEWLASLRDEIEVREFVILDIEDGDVPFTVPGAEPAEAADDAGEPADDAGEPAEGAPAEEGAPEGQAE